MPQTWAASAQTGPVFRQQVGVGCNRCPHFLYSFTDKPLVLAIREGTTMRISNRNTPQHPRIHIRRRRLVLGLTAILGLGGLCEQACATNWVVGTCTDGIDGNHPYATWLRRAVGEAQSGDIIDMTGLTCSTITLVNGAIPIGVANLEIDGPTGSTLTIDGNHQDRVFNQTASGGQLLLSNVTITHGQTSGNGGCIQSVGTVHLFENVTVTGCSAGGKGGGIAAHYVQTDRSTIKYNQGGGIYVSGLRTGYNAEDALIQNTTISGNTGGAGLLGKSPDYLKIDNSTIKNNTFGIYAGVCGGSKVVLSYSNVVGNNSSSTSPSGSNPSGIIAGTAQLFHVTVSGNTGGDAIHIQSCSESGYDLDAEESTIADNTGGGIFAETALIQSSTISGNVGGGIDVQTALLMTNSTVSGNKGTCIGGIAIGGTISENGTGTAKLYNSTVAFNTSSNYGGSGTSKGSGTVYCGGGISGGYVSSDPYVSSYFANISLTSTIVANNVGGTLSKESDVVESSSSALSASNSLVMFSNMPNSSIKSDPQLLPLANNGGSVLTHALGPHSPALGVGSNPKGLGTDERGAGFPRTWANGQVDIGAFQSVDEIFKNGFD